MGSSIIQTSVDLVMSNAKIEEVLSGRRSPGHSFAFPSIEGPNHCAVGTI
jgi:hypothetical protein